VLVLLWVTFFLVVTMPAWADDHVSGVLTRTFVIVEDTDLVGNVTCDMQGAACFAFGVPDVQLRLNGFSITGRADAGTGCAGVTTATDVGITTNARDHVMVRGPGLVQRFRGQGVLVAGSTGARVEGLTSSTNCASGILIASTSFQTLVEGNVVVRNGSASAPCGGI
jgi:hypothetical protein